MEIAEYNIRRRMINITVDSKYILDPWKIERSITQLQVNMPVILFLQ